MAARSSPWIKPPEHRERRGAGCRAVPVLVALLLFVQPAAAQSNRYSTTLRYGSGILDVPVATVLPHLTITATYSGFGLARHGSHGSGWPDGGRDGRRKGTRWLSDGSVAIGLFDRLEAGATLQQLAEARDGGSLVGGFGRLSLLPRSLRRLHLAVGARYVTSPSIGGPYIVATAELPGVEAMPFDYDMTVSAGWGGGLFSAGGDPDFHRETITGGMFAGSALHVNLGTAAGVSVMAEFNGFDANAGVRIDFGGVQVGAFSLGMNHDGSSESRSRKFGVSGSVVVCTGALGLCRRPSDAPADTVTLPAPPPDTVIIERAVEPPAATGTPATLCLSTGEHVQVWVSAAGDTLVGPGRVSLEALGPAVVLAGGYAEGRDWFDGGHAIEFAGRSYRRRGPLVPADCDDIERAGRHDGVPLFADRGAEPPFDFVLVPVRPGVWARYEN